MTGKLGDPTESRPGACVLALIIGRLAQARVARVVGKRDELVVVSTVEALIAESRARCRVSTIICEPRDQQGVLTAAVLRDIRRRAPATALIGYCPKSSASADILALANAGIDELVQEGVDDEGIALRAAYRGSIESCAARQVLNAVKQAIPSELVPVAQYCLRFPREDHSVEGLARAQGVDRKTLLNYARRNGFLAPSTLAMWCRLLLAAALLEGTREPVDRIALSLDFASPSAFRNACRRHVRERPSEWQRPGALERVAKRFCAAAMNGGSEGQGSGDHGT